jgi:hypothetical protein
MNTSNFIWGSLLIVIGVSLLLKAFFGISLPIMRVAIGVFLLYLGLTFLVPTKTIGHETKAIIFNKKYIHADLFEDHAYSVIFGEGTIDLSELDKPTHVQIKSSYSSTTVILDPNIPTKVIIDSMFSNVSLPDETITSFGHYSYKNMDKTVQPLLVVRVKALFSKVIVKNQ